MAHPPRSPSPPAVAEPPDDAVVDISFTFSHDADEQPLSENPPHVLVPSPLPRRTSASTSSFLHPDTTHHLKPRPAAAAMGADGAPDDSGDDAAATSPFNFQTQFISTSPVKSNVGQRRGHRYKHSSVSTQHQIFQEPPRRPPPVLPASLPVPTVREAWASMHRDQRVRLGWCLCHAAVAGFVFFSAAGSLALTALSHLVFFDVGSAAIGVAVDVLGANFEVWRRSSVRHPFGLQRAEVLAGFAMSVFLIFGGFDLLSHNLKHALEGLAAADAHHSHHHHEHLPAHAHGAAHPRVVSPGSVDVAALAAGVSTLVGAYGLGGRARRLTRVSYPSYLASVLPRALSDNPFHGLTLLFSALLLLLPLLSVPTSAWLDRAVCAAIALSMFGLGSRLAVAQGFMLLMSYSGRGPARSSSSSSSRPASAVAARPAPGDTVAGVLREIEAEPAVARVEAAQFWQVHYGLCMANLRVRVVRGCDDGAAAQLRARVARVIQNRLGEGYGRGGSLRWEVTMQTHTDGW